MKYFMVVGWSPDPPTFRWLQYKQNLTPMKYFMVVGWSPDPLTFRWLQYEQNLRGPENHGEKGSPVRI
jgi:hypothetical protein